MDLRTPGPDFPDGRTHRTRTRRLGWRAGLAAVLSVALALTACSDGGSDSSIAEEGRDAVLEKAKAREKTWVITNSGPGVVTNGKSLDFTVAKMPTVRAVEALKAEGWNVEARFIEANESVVQALVQQEADAINVALPTVLAAVAGGVPLRVFGGGSRFGFTIVGRSDITGPQDLDGKRIAYQAPISAGTLAAKLWVLDAGVEPQYITMTGSAVRIEALVAGQLDATAVSMGFDAEVVEQGEPGEFKLLYSPLDEYPFLLDTVLTYNETTLDDETRVFLEEFHKHHAESVRELEANPAVLDQWLTEHEVTTSPDAPTLLSLFFEDLGVSPETIDQQVELMIETGQIEADDSFPAGSELIDPSIWEVAGPMVQ
nr:ABC transporter substrate-binding protein [Micromonospora sp. DSM 115978]